MARAHSRPICRPSGIRIRVMCRRCAAHPHWDRADPSHPMPRTQVSAGSRPLSRSLFGPPGLAVGLALAGLALAGLDGCATYQPLPLPSHDDLVTQVAPIGLPPLDMVTVATLAVLNNPDLKARRAAVGVAQAQAFAEGLLPDPQLSYSVDHPVDHVISSTDPRYPEYNAYGLGLSLDLQTLLTHSSRRAAASAAYRQARLELLWQEWQTVAEARTLYVQLSIATQQRNFLS